MSAAAPATRQGPTVRPPRKGARIRNAQEKSGGWLSTAALSDHAETNIGRSEEK